MLVDKIRLLNTEFKEYHFTVVDLMQDDKERLKEELTTLDDYKDKTASLLECLQQLCPESKAVSTPAPSTDHSHYLQKGLRHMEMRLKAFNETRASSPQTLL